jgi:uncharacterized protein (TIGR03435 family)
VTCLAVFAAAIAQTADAPPAQQQLGLKLEESKSVDVLVIDHAEKTPSEN